jgi:hypothetical protein
MSKFFLNNQSLNINDFEIFKNGIIQLMSIEKKQEHIFFRNESCYQINHFAERIFPNIYSNRDIFNLYDFFAKLSPVMLKFKTKPLQIIIAQVMLMDFLD